MIFLQFNCHLKIQISSKASNFFIQDTMNSNKKLKRFLIKKIHHPDQKEAQSVLGVNSQINF